MTFTQISFPLRIVGDLCQGQSAGKEDTYRYTGTDIDPAKYMYSTVLVVEWGWYTDSETGAESPRHCSGGLKVKGQACLLSLSLVSREGHLRTSHSGGKVKVKVKHIGFYILLLVFCFKITLSLRGRAFSNV